MKPKKIIDIYPLSPLQKGLFFSYLYKANESSYNDVAVYKLTGTVDSIKLQKSIESLLNEIDIFNASFQLHAKGPLQFIHSNLDHKVSNQDCTRINIQISEILELESNTKFKLEQAPLIRTTLYQLNSNEVLLAIASHHIILDGWSMNQFVNLCLARYHGETIDFIPYKHYLQWLKNSNVTTDSILFWKQKWNQFAAPSLIPRTRYNLSGKIYKKYTFTLDDSIIKPLTSFCQNHKVTINTVIHAAWSFLLSRYCNTDTPVFALTHSGRTACLQGVEKIIGLLINTIPCLHQLKENEKIADYCQRIQTDIFDQIQHSMGFSLNEIIEQNNRDKSYSTQPSLIFNSLIIFQNFINTTDTNKYPIQAQWIDGFEQNEYPLSIIVVPDDNKIQFDLVYQTDFCSGSFISELSISLVEMIKFFLVNPQLNYYDAELFTKYYPIISDTITPTQEDCEPILKTICKAIATHSHSIAIYHKDKIITYQQLSENINRIANLLLKNNVSKNDYVVLLVDRDELLVATILAIFKINAIYVPISPIEHSERIQSNLAIFFNPIIITTPIYLIQHKQALCKYQIINLQDMKKCSSATIKFNDCSTPNDIAYSMFNQSEPTHNPKTITGSHLEMTNLITSKITELSINASDIIAQTASQNSVHSLWQLLSALLVGASIVIMDDEDTIIAKKIICQLKNYNVSLYETKPQLLPNLTEHIQINFKEQLPLRQILVTGEPFPKKYADEWLNTTGVPIIYYYTSNKYLDLICQFKAEINSIIPSTYLIPIGKPLPNVKLYILDENFLTVPKGATGQLFISEDCKSYKDQLKNIVDEKCFIQRSSKLISDKTLFNTGILVRQLDDETLLYIRKINLKAKIEKSNFFLQNIDARIILHPLVRQCLTIVKSIVNTSLISYIVLQKQNQFTLDINCVEVEIKELLIDQVATDLIPDFFIFIEEFPLSVTGMIDIAQLPEPIHSIKELPVDIDSNLIHQMISIWSEILGIKVKQHDNFFEIGGHSLKAMQLIAEIRRQLNIKLELDTLFKNPTVRLLAQEIQLSTTAHITNQSDKIVKKVQQTNISVSFAQKRLLFLQSIMSNPRLYNITLLYNFEGKIDLDKLHHAYFKLLKKHECLRTYFTESQDGEFFQIILKAEDTPNMMKQKTNIEWLDYSFDIYKEPLFRGFYTITSPDTFQLGFVAHHLIIDGFSLNILCRDFVDFYNQVSNPEDLTLLCATKITYRDYCQWQNDYVSTKEFGIQLDYWKQKLIGSPETSTLPLDFCRSAEPTFQGKTIILPIQLGISRQIRQFAKENRCSLFNILSTIFMILIDTYNNQKDIIIGTPVANRQHIDSESIIGLFVNMLPLRLSIEKHLSFSELLYQSTKVQHEAFQHQNIPLEMILEQIDLTHAINYHPLFQIIFSYQVDDLIDTMNLDTASGTRVSIDNQTSKFDFSLVLVDTKDTITLHLEYSTEIFGETTMAFFIKAYSNLMLNCINQPNKAIKQLVKLSPEQQNELILLGKNPINLPLFDTNIYNIFHVTALKYANHTALVYQNMQITYADLLHAVDDYVELLKQYSLSNNCCIGVMLSNKSDYIPLLLAILKMNFIYIPIDHNLPFHRINQLIKETGVVLLIVDKIETDLVHQLKSNASTVSDFQNRYILNFSAPIDSKLPNTIAYVLFTSGTTATPKAIACHHYSLINIINYMHTLFPINNSDKTILWCNLSFDVSLYEIFIALLHGAELHVLDEETRVDHSAFYQYLERKQITAAYIPRFLLTKTSNNLITFPQSLRYLLTGSEPIPNYLINDIKNKYPNLIIVNAYGPTETTILTTAYISTNNNETYVNAPIGKPISNCQILIVDKELSLVPLGGTGEIIIGGEGVAYGYLNPASTSEKYFFIHGFEDEYKRKYYRSGDLGKWLPSGDLLFLARDDKQIKYFGNRIDLAEIEAIICQHHMIETCLVYNPIINSQPLLIAYVISFDEIRENDNNDDLTKELRSFTLNKLPTYMCPNFFVQIKSLPINANGKIELLKLPLPPVMKAEQLLDPENEIQKKLYGIWSEILNINNFSITDNYFSLGGDSIHSIKIVARAKKIGLMIRVKDIIHYPTIKDLAYQCELITETPNNKNFIELSELNMTNENFEILSQAIYAELDD